VIVRRGSARPWLSGIAGKTFQIRAAFISVDGHQGHDEVGLVELLALAIDADEHLRDSFRVNGSVQGQSREGIMGQPMEFAYSRLRPIDLLWRESAHLFQVLNETTGELEDVDTGLPELRDVRDVRLVFDDGVNSAVVYPQATLSLAKWSYTSSRIRNKSGVAGLFSSAGL
jgi:hypothetical protein